MPLDVGREQRLATAALRDALAQCDQGCAFPGCDRPPRYCHAHHRISWLDGGQTKLDNLCLLTAGTGSPPAAADPVPAEELGALVPVPAGVIASFAVYDREHRKFTAVRQLHARFRTASVVKLLIALDYLTQHDPELDLDK